MSLGADVHKTVGAGVGADVGAREGGEVGANDGGTFGLGVGALLVGAAGGVADGNGVAEGLTREQLPLSAATAVGQWNWTCRGYMGHRRKRGGVWGLASAAQHHREEGPASRLGAVHGRRGGSSGQ